MATLGSSFILSSFGLACTCHVPYGETTVFGVGMNVGCDDCNDDGRTSPVACRLHDVQGLVIPAVARAMGVLPSTQPHAT